jgi:hypothetical protein
MNTDPHSDRHPEAYRFDTLRRIVAKTGVPEDRKDASTVIFQRELEVLQARVYERKYPALKAADGQVLPMRGTIPRGAETASYKMFSHTGIAKWITTGGIADVEMVGVSATRKQYTVDNIAIGYGWSLQEIENAAFANVPLQAQELFAADLATARKLNDVCLYGDVTKGFNGFLNHPNMTVMSAPAGAAGATSWATTGATSKTALEMVADISLAVRTMRSLTEQVHQPNRCWVPPSFWERTNDLVIPNTSKMARQHLTEVHGGMQFAELDELETASATGGPAIMFADLMGPDEMWFEVPMRSEPHGPFEDFLRTNFALRSQCGGFITPYPLALLRMDFA